MIRVALMASGHGSNAEALIRRSRTLDSIEIVNVITDNPEAGVIQRCLNLNQEFSIIDSSKFVSKVEHENEILSSLFKGEVDWIFLCGYLRILSPHFLATWKLHHNNCNQIVNIHPSKLPDLRGLGSIERAWDSERLVTGVTLHYVEKGVDTGPILDQRQLKIDRNSSFESFKEKMHLLEHEIYENFLVSLARGSPQTFHCFKDV